MPRPPRVFSNSTPSLPHDDTGPLGQYQAADTQPDESEARAGRLESHAESYSDERFWRKMTRFGKRAGREVALKALQLYFVLKRPDVPLWAKSTIIGALGYFISPLDAIPDFIAGVGYTDDASVLAAALVAVSIYIDEEVKCQAESTLARWWPEAEQR